MRKLITSKWFIISLVVLLLVATVVISLLPGSPVNKAIKPLANVANPVQGFVKRSGDTLSDFWAAIADGMAIREENEDLKSQIADLQYELTKNKEAAVKYEELKDAFHIKDTFGNYDIFGASVMSREADEWFSVIQADIGTDDGIVFEEGNSYAVVDVEMNLVGRIISVSDSKTKILPVLHEAMTVSCKVDEINGANLTVTGDAGLKNDGLCLVKDIGENVKLEPGTKIVTSGQGGLFPEGIYVGTIESVDDSNPLNITATLRPNSNVSKLSDVFIMVPLKQASADTDESAKETKK